MAVRAGEEVALSLFADVHYFFSPPNAKPVSHRFEKRSYVYLLLNRSRGQGRLEVANNAGTPDQDAVSGSLQSVQLEYSTKHPTMCTINTSGPPGGDRPDVQEWHLANPDQHGEGRFLYRLHSIDLYFWTEEDEHQFLQAVKGLLSPSQIKSDEASPARMHQDSTSSVVQRLEHMAVTDSAGKPGSRGSGTAQLHEASLGMASPKPGFGPDHAPSHSTPQPASQAPLAYNPAAPAAPEPIRHREKTPPPVDANDGTGLQQALAHDSGRPYSTASNQHAPSFPPPPPKPLHQQSFPGPPQQQPSYTSAVSVGTTYLPAQSSPTPSSGPYSPPPQAASFSPFPPQGPGQPTGVPQTSYVGQSSSSITSYHPTQGTPASVSSPYTPPSHAAPPYGTPPPPGPSYGAPGQGYPAASASPGTGHGASAYGPTSPPATHTGTHAGTQDGAYPPAYPQQQQQQQTPQPHYDPSHQPQHAYSGSIPQPGSQISGQAYTGYPAYQYGQLPQQQQQQQQPGGHVPDPGAIHQQAYTPSTTDASTLHGHGHQHPHQYLPTGTNGAGASGIGGGGVGGVGGMGGGGGRPSGQQGSKLDQGAAKLEKGVGKLLKRIEKRMG